MNLKLVCLFFLSIFGTWAQGIELKCRVAVFAQDLPQGSLEKKFDTTELALTGHVGAMQEFSLGGHGLVVTADGRWLGLRWTHSGRVVADNISAVGPQLATESRALITFNPTNRDESVHLDCLPKTN